MLGRLNHVALAVPDLAAATALYRDRLGARVSAPQPLPEHGVTVVFVDLPNTRVELLEPLGDASPIAAFLDRNPQGGMHHLCYEVADIRAARDRIVAEGAPHPRRRRADDRRARQPGALPAPEGFRRHADRAGRGSAAEMSLRQLDRHLLRDLVAVPFRRAAVRREEPARGERRDARDRARRAASAAPSRARRSPRRSWPASFSPAFIYTLEFWIMSLTICMP